ncbi:hypothetical protein ETSB_0308 [cyanobacterium endosymbiont of Epithemia turgida isolate EtSB Lake Yunoko]|nr:hypothetical protein ETSB_0308 [cyanobacterium endosymbiont of Epithemia turgida isolate EtSB Lake Yunoko]
MYKKSYCYFDKFTKVAIFVAITFRQQCKKQLAKIIMIFSVSNSKNKKLNFCSYSSSELKNNNIVIDIQLLMNSLFRKIKETY